MNENTDLDKYDRKILDILAQNGRISMTALASEIGLSKTPTQLRVQKLENEKIIKGYRALIDPVKLGLEHVAFVEVRLTDTREAALRKFNDAITRIPEIEQAHMMAAQFDYLLKIRTKNMQEFRRILGSEISALPYVASTSTFVAMEAVKEEYES